MRTLFPILVLAAAGCIDAPDDAVDDIAVGTTVQYAGNADCPDFMCGSNSPVIDGLGFHELDATMQMTNLQGFRIVSASKNGEPYRLAVVNGAFIAHHLTTNARLEGDAIDGMVMKVTNGSTTYLVSIRWDLKGVWFWAKLNGARVHGPAYILGWRKEDAPSAYGGYVNVCLPPPDGESTLGQEELRAVVFEGDRIEAKSKQVTGFDDRWFNIGCAGHTLAKLHLTGHTHAATSRGFESTRDHRTMMIKMLSADYCGGGEAMTVAGIDLTWRDDAGTMSYDVLYPPLEAKWTAQGAACLNTPRVNANPTDASDAWEGYGSAFVDVEDRIARACRAVGRTRPPRCFSSTSETKMTHHLYSANP